jgi:ribosomal protein L37AE/L43A
VQIAKFKGMSENYRHSFFYFQKDMPKAFDVKQKGVETNCYDCQQRLLIRLEAKCYTCPKCGWHQKFDAQQMSGKLNLIFRHVFGSAPTAPQNN